VKTNIENRIASENAKAGSALPSEQDIQLLIRLKHPNPHAILGAHPGPSGIVVRVLRPGAQRVILHADDGAAWPLKCLDPAGLFELRLTDRETAFPYRVEAEYDSGARSLARDPYCFPPTIGGVDLHLLGEGRHELLHAKLGSHPQEFDGVLGVAFAVWAPNAEGVSVVGDFNSWDGRIHMMRCLGSSGIWEMFVPELAPGTLYKYEIRSTRGRAIKTDPYAQSMEVPPKTASIVFSSEHQWKDDAWMAARTQRQPWKLPLSIYEVHLGSWRRVPEEQGRALSYRELAPLLAKYAKDMGFTHVELLPVQEYPFSGSWGYQASGYFAPTARYGNPDDFRWFVDHLHQQGLGVIVDWVPAHFPKDDFALARFDGTALYEHLDPRQGEHPDWGTYIFNYGRGEVRNFLLASALYWLSELHVDGLRVDAVASMLYLDYSRRPGQWLPNAYGGRENLEAISFLRDLNQTVHRRCPGVLMIAEESTAWPAVSRPTELGGLGFGFKWNMGWMHDTLDYFEKNPVHRRYHHQQLTFGLLYAWSENFVLPLSHDEVAHGKGSLLDKMPGDHWQKFANLRLLYAHMWAHPGKKLLFMGGEFGQWREWNHDESLDWHLLQQSPHAGIQLLLQDLNRLYQAESALSEADFDSAGFQWIDANNGDQNIIAYLRVAPSSGRKVVCIANGSPVVRRGYRVGLPGPGWYREILNTDATAYGGSNVGNAGGVQAQACPWHGQPCSADVILPPLACLWFVAPDSADTLESTVERPPS